MISTTQFKLLYNDLYEQMRKYIWDIDVVNALADVEIESYKAFPDIAALRKYVSDLRYLISGYSVDDEDLFAALDAFDEYYSDDEDMYEKIERFREVINNEDNKGE